MDNNITITCSNCGKKIKSENKFCDNCGKAVNNVQEKLKEKKYSKVTVADYNLIYRLNEKEMIETFVKNGLTKANIQENNNYLPSGLIQKKKIFSLIFSLLLFIYIVLIFFHFPFITYIIGAIILLVFFVQTKKITLVKYMIKQIKERPSEKLINVILSVKETFKIDNSKTISLLTTMIAIILPLILFMNPVILYEKAEYQDAYVVRFYAFGLTNFKTATIPESHNGKQVVGLRGNAFSNMFFLKEATLPDTIVEIRGEAFKNDYSLETVKLPKNLLEIKGSTFENCYSLTYINIPDSVTRIGGHAFYNNDELYYVSISENSKLKEIGSSAFRKCKNLYSINLPQGVSINERAFKESPTIINYYYRWENETYE